MRSPLLFMIATAIAVAAAACSMNGESNPLRTRPVTVSDPTDPPNDNDDDDDTKPNDALAPPDASAPPTNDAGQDGAPPKTPPNLGAFEGAAAFASTLGAVTRKPQHNFAGNTPTTNPAGRPCLNCHGAAGPAPRFAFAGTIYKDAAGTQPAPRVEVRIVDATNKAASTYTDADGNYFIPFATTGALTYPAKAGARDADTMKLMTAGSMNGNCNSCHRVGGSTSPIPVQ